MGGSYSSTQEPAASAAPPMPLGVQKPVVNENGGDIVLIPVDASKQAEAAFLWYLKHSHKPENEVRILHCQELCPTSPIMSEHTFRTESWMDMMKSAKEQGGSLTKQYEEKLQLNGVRGTVQFKVGKPGEVVVAMAEKEGASQIVMGTRGFGIIRRTVLGSVSEYVIHHTRIPVTVVPKEAASWFF